MMNTTPSDSPAPRIAFNKVSKLAFPGMAAIQAIANKTSLERPILELVKIRASNLNGCAFCIDMHVRDAIAHGETIERITMVAAYEEAAVYTPREKAALIWTDALTDLAGNGVDDETFDEVRAHFSDEELADLTLVIVAINGWNRFNVGFRVPAGYPFRANG